MAASLDSPGATSDIDPPSSPPEQHHKRSQKRGRENLQMATSSRRASPDSERPALGPSRASNSRSGKGGSSGKDKDKDKDKDREKDKDKDGNGNGVTGKVKHLKKEDGEPLWRKDIQYDFLRAIFCDDTPVFTNSYDGTMEKQNFADLYIDTMARSSKTSKILRDKLLSDREAAKGMAMVCLLVNMGRMNTTLNFFPEMRAQLRTYHAIPSLQAYQDANAYKQLQDAPRLKSILKGGCEDREEPTGLDKIRKIDSPPRTNPVNLIFIICQAAYKIADLHFPPGQEFHDLVMKTKYTSSSRARAFLWLMWFYLESDFTQEGCEENPFGPGVDYGQDVANQGVPWLDEMTAEAEAAENVDTEGEKQFGREKQAMRAKILEADQQFLADRDTKRARARAAFPEDGPAILPRIRPSKNESDMDSTRSTPPPRAPIPRSGVSASALGVGSTGSTNGAGGGGSGAGGSSGPGRRGAGASLKWAVSGPSPPTEPGSHRGQIVEGLVARKPRPPTAHQLAVERNRAQRVEYIISCGLRRQHHESAKTRRVDGAIYRAIRRYQGGTAPEILDDSEEEDAAADNDGTQQPHQHQSQQQQRRPAPGFRERGVGGMSQLLDEPDDFGEAVTAYASSMRRAARRLDRWDNHDGDEPLGVVAPRKRKRLDDEDDDGEDDGYGDDTHMMMMMNGGGDDDTMMANEETYAEGDTYMDGDVTMMDDGDDLDDQDHRTMGGVDDPDKTDLAGDSDMD